MKPIVRKKRFESASRRFEEEWLELLAATALWFKGKEESGYCRSPAGYKSSDGVTSSGKLFTSCPTEIEEVSWDVEAQRLITPSFQSTSGFQCTRKLWQRMVSSISVLSRTNKSHSKLGKEENVKVQSTFEETQKLGSVEELRRYTGTLGISSKSKDWLRAKE
jgi:hypothetical protein